MEAAAGLMSAQARSAGWVRSHLAAPRSGRSRALIAIGVVCFLAGAALGVQSLSPMFSGPSGTPAVGSLPTPSAGAPLETAGPGALSAAPYKPVPVNSVAFSMEVPALGYRATVLEGVDAKQLDRGPGHYVSSAWPGQSGNVAIAAHNVYWLSFNRLRAGDRVIIRTADAVFTYEITASRIVEPNDSSPLNQTESHTLTLTTCYPLWAGAYATKRLVFTGREIAGASFRPHDGK